MFPLTYTGRELRRRLGRTILTALGLAAGVGLVIGIVGVSQGLDEAQGRVLAPLRSVGTDVLVTRVAGATSSPTGQTTTTTTTPQGAPGQGGGGGGFFRGGGGGPGGGALGQINSADATALLTENQSVVTDLAKLGKPGDKFTHDFFVPATLISFPDAAVQQVSKLSGVSSTVGGLTLLATHQTGTVPQIVAELQTAPQTVTQTVAPPPLTDAERAAVRQCVAAQGGVRPAPAQPGPTTPPGQGQGGGEGGGGFGGGRFEQCLPQRLQQYMASIRIPQQTLRQVLDPPSTDITATTYTAAGVDPSHPDEGLVTRAQLTTGTWYQAGAGDQVLLNVAYANKNNLKVGSDLPINGTTYHVVGLVNPTLSGNTADVYFPLGTMQQLAGKSGRVNMVLVKAKDAGSVDKVAGEISKMLPGAQVVTTKALADQVTGSLKDAKNLADRLGGVLAVIVLAAAFAIAVLLTLSSVAKRVREIGTLRAIGWGRGMVVRQLLLETMGIGLLGGIVGVGVGLGAIAAVSQFSPTFTTSTPVVPSFASSSLARLVGASQSVGSTTVHLHAPVHAMNLVLGVVFALVGGLIAGAVGGWRAARLQPARALADVG